MRHLPASSLVASGLVALALLLPGAARANIIYVLNSGDASISILDSTTREEVRRIPVLREVHHLLLTPDRSELVVGDSGANELIFLDPATGEVKRRERFSNPYHMEYSPDGKYLVVTSLRRDQVDIYDAATRTLLNRLRVPDKPSHLAFSPDSRLAYVTLQGAKGLMAIDLATGRPAWTAEVGSQPAGVIWHRGKLLVGIMGSDHIAVVNPPDGKVERTVFLGRGAHTIFPAPDGKALYVTSRVDSRISVLDPETLDVVARWDIPGGPDCIAFDPEGKLWVTLRWVARVAMVDPATGEAITIPVGRSPHGVFVQPRREPMPPQPSGALPPPSSAAA
ncbi:MAG: YncE family protein, partial [Acetobacteraceae bacterium]